MEEIFELVRELTGEDGKVDAKALEERLMPAAEALKKEEEARLADRRRLALVELLVRGGAKDVDYLVFRLEGRAKFGEDGALLEGEALLAEARAEFSEFFARKKSRLNGVRPGEGDSGAALGAEEFERMGYRERLRLFEEDPELYRSLRGGRSWE